MDGFAEHLLGVRLDAVVQSEIDVAPGDLRTLALDVDHTSAWILDDRLLAGAARERVVELELQAR